MHHKLSPNLTQDGAKERSLSMDGSQQNSTFFCTNYRLVSKSNSESNGYYIFTHASPLSSTMWEALAQSLWWPTSFLRKRPMEYIPMSVVCSVGRAKLTPPSLSLSLLPRLPLSRLCLRYKRPFCKVGREGWKHWALKKGWWKGCF